MMRNDPIKHVFIWPAVLVVLAISIFPLIYSLTTSFLSYRLIPPIPPRVVWLGNYAACCRSRGSGMRSSPRR